MVDNVDISMLERRIAEIRGETPSPLKRGSGDGTSGGMEARVAKVEATLEHVSREMADVKADLRELRTQARTDFRLLFGAIIAVALGLAGLLAKGFHWL